MTLGQLIKADQCPLDLLTWKTTKRAIQWRGGGESICIGAWRRLGSEKTDLLSAECSVKNALSIDRQGETIKCVVVVVVVFILDMRTYLNCKGNTPVDLGN